MYECPICKNKDKRFFGIKNNQIYCRKCISLSRGKKAISNFFSPNDYHVKLNYDLTKSQSKASEEIYNYIRRNKNVYVSAVCGAGKTELVYKSIEYIINQGLKVAFAIPRKDVVKEIYLRLKDDFKSIKVCQVYGGKTDDLNGQIVVLTTHQLYRYKNYFNLLIIDEFDCFPYAGSMILENFMKQAVKGPIIYLSATIDEELKKQNINIVNVNKRFHNHPLPEPVIVRYNSINKFHILKEKLIYFVNKKKQVLVFVPTIEIGLVVSKKLSLPFVYSSKKDKDELVDDFKRNKFSILLTTSILERGITICDVQVIVFEANHELFTTSSLIQIAGRVGRKYKAPEGEVLFLSCKISKSMKESINEIKCKNQAIV